MMVPVVQSVNILCNAHFTVWVSGAVDLRKYHCSRFAIELHVLPRQDSTGTGYFGGVLEQAVKGPQIAPTNLIELWADLPNIWQVMPVKLFQQLAESIPRRAVAVIKAREGPTRY
ncbi:hypothetical protein TNCV_60191 [Trichonephila clavipes]|nr:hypothetical protein TNCV_60191 [Trichonephila clavipes]